MEIKDLKKSGTFVPLDHTTMLGTNSEKIFGLALYWPLKTGGLEPCNTYHSTPMAAILNLFVNADAVLS